MEPCSIPSSVGNSPLGPTRQFLNTRLTISKHSQTGFSGKGMTIKDFKSSFVGQNAQRKLTKMFMRKSNFFNSTLKRQ